mmetsp:Transcript_16811/g.54990  ORF Transcript_16811/g.54990 Transcript_16811/m.54990 type:complete len:113 (-) Transcript_16811:329-667(-)
MDEMSIRFRLGDGTDIGPFTFSPVTSLWNVKERIIAEWPRDNDRPGSTAELKLIHSGKILDNNKTLGEVGVPANMLVTMHVVIRPPVDDTAKGGGRSSGDQKQSLRCGCVVQ